LALNIFLPLSENSLNYFLFLAKENSWKHINVIQIMYRYFIENPGKILGKV